MFFDNNGFLIPPTSPSSNEQKLQEYYQRQSIDIGLQTQKEIAVFDAKTRISTINQIELARAKQEIKAQAVENRRAHYKGIEISDHSSIFAIFKNTNNENFQKRECCNLRYPHLIALLHGECPSEKIFLLRASVNDQKVSIFLDQKKTGNSTYIYGKLASNGITFYSDSVRQRKLYATDLIGKLITLCTESITIFDLPGWHRTADRNLIYVKEEALTWNNCKKQTL